MVLLLLSRFSHVWLCATPEMTAYQAPPSLEFSGKNTGVGCHLLLQCMKVKVKVKSLSRVRLLATPWTAAYQAPQPMGFSRQEYWSGCHCLLQPSIQVLIFAALRERHFPSPIIISPIHTVSSCRSQKNNLKIDGQDYIISYKGYLPQMKFYWGPG